MVTNTELANTITRTAQSAIVNNDADYYLLIKDYKGNILSYSFSDSVSIHPFSGFSHPLPEYYKPLIQLCIDDNNADLTSFKEYITSVKVNEISYNFLVTRFPSISNNEIVIHYLMREAEHIDGEILKIKHKLRAKCNLNTINSKCISSVSHDFRTPLSIIYANLQLLEHHEFQLDKETIEDAFSLSRMAVKSLLRVLDKVTVIDSINKNRLEYKPTNVNLELLCNNLVKELNDAEVVPGRVKYIHDPRILEPVIDEYLFTSLFTHLIFNALSYSKKVNTVIFKSELISDKLIRFTVEDSGIGLTDEQIEKLHNFFNDQSATISDGIGLGLAIVRECLILLKGKLTINSVVIQGSKFIIDLPV